MAGDLHPVARQFAPELAAAGRNLPGVELGLAEVIGPVGYQGAVGGTSDGILIDAGAGHKKTGDKIAVATGGGGDDGKGIKLSESGEVGLKREDIFGAGEYAQGVASLGDMIRLCSEGTNQGGGGGAGLCGAAGKIEFEQIVWAERKLSGPERES